MVRVKLKTTFDFKRWISQLFKGRDTAADEAIEFLLKEYRKYPEKPPTFYEWTYNLFRSWKIVDQGKGKRMLISDARGPNGPNFHYSNDVVGPGQWAIYKGRWPRTDKASELYAKKVEKIFAKNIKIG